MATMTHIFREKRWKVLPVSRNRKKSKGDCEAPHMPNKQIRIPMTGDTRSDLDTIIHEGLHACLWDLDDEAVQFTAHDIARLLWRLGWRKTEGE